MLEEAYKTLTSQQSPLKIAYDRMQQDHERLSQQYQEQSQQLEAKRDAVIELQLILKTEANKLTSLEEALKNAHDKIESLRHDSQFALQEKDW